MVAILIDPVGGEQYQIVIRFLENGALDQNFGSAGVFTIPDSEGYLQILNKLANDNFIVNYIGADQNYIVKYFPDTTIDLSFGNGGRLEPMGLNQTFRSVETNTDDTFLAYGEEVIDGIVHFIIKKFSADGILDFTFGTNGVKKYPITNDENINYFTFKVTDNEKVLITYKDFSSSSPQSYVQRFLESGVPDATFGNNGVVTIPIEEEYRCNCFEFNDESVLIGCSYYDIDLETVVKRSIKLNSNGNLDQNFANAGYLDGVRAVFIQQNQQFIGENHYSDFEGGTLLSYKKYYSSGSQNTSFGAMSSPFTVDSPKLSLLNSGKFFVATNQIWYEANPYTNTVLLRYYNNPLGIEENTLQSFTIYPNPSSGIFTIASESFIDPTPFQVTDVSGKIIQKGVLSQAENQVDLSNTANGIYFLQAGGATFKLITN